MKSTTKDKIETWMDNVLTSLEPDNYMDQVIKELRSGKREFVSLKFSFRRKLSDLWWKRVYKPFLHLVNRDY